MKLDNTNYFNSMVDFKVELDIKNIKERNVVVNTKTFSKIYNNLCFYSLTQLTDNKIYWYDLIIESNDDVEDDIIKLKRRNNMSKINNNFFVTFEKSYTPYKDRFHKPTKNKIESLDNWIEVRNNLLIIKLYNDGRIDVKPNPIGSLIDKKALDKKKDKEVK